MKPGLPKALCSIFVRVTLGLCGLGAVGSLGMGESARAVLPDAVTGARIRTRYGNLPLRFEPNVGQADRRVKFLSRGPGYLLFLTQDAAVLKLSRSQKTIRGRPSAKADTRASVILRMNLVHANKQAKVDGFDELPGRSNYFLGDKPRKWRTGIPNYAGVKYEEIYPGVNLVYYGNQRKLEHDFVVSPGADPRVITLQVHTENWKLETGNSGLEKLRWKLETVNPKLEIAPNGDLVVQINAGEVRFHKPTVYQPRTLASGSGNSESPIHNSEVVDGRYVLTADNRIQFAIANYDKNRPLVIDPVLAYSTFLGGTGGEMGAGIKVDASGNAYIVGSTDSSDFPVSPGAYQRTYGGFFTCIYGSPCGDAFVTKLSADGTAILYSTFLGGSGAENGTAIAIDASGSAYVTGSTGSTNFPVTTGVFQPTCGPGCYGNAFISKLSPDGSSLVYSTFLGGSDQGSPSNDTDVGTGIAVDSSGNAYVTGTARSTDFPVTASSFKATMPNTILSGFVAKLNSTASALVYSTYLGGSVQDAGAAIALDTNGNAYVTGESYSPDFPTTPGAFQIPFGTTADVVSSTSFVTKLSPDGSTLVYSASLGGTGGASIAVDSSGAAYVTGGALDFFPTTSTALGSNCDTGAFVAKLTPDGSGLTYSTQFCAISGAATTAVAIDSSGSAYLTGSTDSTAFPATADALQTTIGNTCCFSDAFLTKLTPDGSAMMYSTYLGGGSSDAGSAVAVDSSGSAYLTGYTTSADFPTANPLQATYRGGSDGFVSKVSPPAPSASLSPATVDFGNWGIGVASTPRSVVLTNLSGSMMDVQNITTTGDFSQSNNCGSNLAAGAQCSIQVTFKPSAAGALTGVLTVSAGGSAQSVQLTGTGVNGPVVALSPSTPRILNPPYPQFVNQPAGTTSPPLTITVTNIGNAVLTVNGETLTGPFGFAGNNCFEVVPQASCTLGVVYQSYGSSNGDLGDLGIEDNASDSPQGIRLLGLGAPAGLRFLSLGLKFSAQPLGTTSAAQTVALMNGTGAQVTLGSITTTGDFAQTSNCGNTLANAAYCTFSVTFTPAGTGIRLGTLQVPFNGSGSPAVVNLLGSSGSAQTVTLSTASLTFGGQNVGTTSSAQTVTLSNVGTSALTLTSISITGTNSGDFGEADNCGASVAASASCAIHVTFTPTATGTRTGTLTISDINGAAGSTETVRLTGSGVAGGPGTGPAGVASSRLQGSNADGRLEVFVRGLDNALWHKWQLSAGSSAWSGWTSLGGILTSDPIVAQNADGRLEVFIQGNDAALWHISQTAPSATTWNAWSSLGGKLTSQVAVARNADGRLEAFVRGTDNALWHKAQVAAGGPGWSGWTSLGGTLTSDPVLAQNADGRLEVFIRGIDSALWHKFQTAPSATTWNAWSSLGGALTGDVGVARNGDDRLEVFVRGSDNALWHRSQLSASGSGWSGWSWLGGILTSNPVVGQNADGRLEVFIRGNDVALWHIFQTAPSAATWSTWGSLGGGLTGDPAVALNADGLLEVFVHGMDDALWHISQQTAGGPGWSGWASLGGVMHQ